VGQRGVRGGLISKPDVDRAPQQPQVGNLGIDVDRRLGRPEGPVEVSAIEARQGKKGRGEDVPAVQSVRLAGVQQRVRE
jgi:hypothetical protein